MLEQLLLVLYYTSTGIGANSISASTGGDIGRGGGHGDCLSSVIS